MTLKIRFCRPIILAIVCLLGLSISAGCATKRDSALQMDATEILQARAAGDFAMTLDAAEAAWAKRINRADLETAIARWELAATLETPELSEDERRVAIAEIFERLTRAYYFLADSHIAMTGDDQSANHPEMMVVYERGVTAAERALALRDPAFVAKINAGESWQKHVASANPEAIPALYWYATNLGKWALLEGIATILARKDDIKATMDFITESDPNFFHGAAYRYFGVYYTKLPFGKEPESSAAAFTRSIEISPNYFATHVLLAENLATLNNDRALFDKHLTLVLETPANVDPELEPENFFEQEKARRLQQRGDRLFR